MARPVVVLLHIGKSLQGAYTAPVDGVGASFVEGGFSGSYAPPGGLAGRYPTLGAFLRAEVPEWRPGAPLVLACWSAGCFAAREWMRNGADRELVNALLLLDGLHSPYDAEGGCQLSNISGVVQYGRLCARQPRKHLLAVTHSEIIPPGYASTTQCANLLRDVLPKSRAIAFVAGPGSDPAAHTAQVSVLGPRLMREFVEPRLTGEVSAGADWQWLLYAAAGAGTGVALAAALSVLVS